MASYRYHLPIRSTLNEAWYKIYGTKSTFLMASLLTFFIVLFLIWFEEFAKNFSNPIYVGISLFSSLVNFLLIAGLTYLGIRAYDSPISCRMLLQVFKPKMAITIIGLYFLKLLINFILAFMIVSILFGVLGFIIEISLLLFIQTRLILSLGFVLDKKVPPWHAMKLSFEATRSQFWRLVWLCMIQFTLYFISIFSLGILFIWTIPFTMILYGIIYQNLAGELGRKNPKIYCEDDKSLAQNIW